MQLGWIDFSKRDRQKVLDVMNLLQEQGAVDELGIGIVRDAFANYFFPGTSTVQTRAKYLLIVPYILKEIVDGRYGKDVNRILRALDSEEKQCGIRFLETSAEADGIIGKRVLPKDWVSRKPSDIYWNGIKTYGIFMDHSLSIKEYVSLAVKLRDEKTSGRIGNRGDAHTDADRDDTDAGEQLNFQFWNLPVYDNKWKDSLNIELTQEEAIFLKNQIMKTCKGSLLDFLLLHNININKYDGFLSLAKDMEDKVDKELACMIKLACDFNVLVYMARVRYNIILSGSENKEADLEWSWLEEECASRASVDISAVFEKLKIYNPKTFIFLCMLQECFQRNRISDADELIKKREIQLKGINRAKLTHTKENDSDKWVGGRWLDYRFYDARRIINDIYNGEKCAYV